MHLQLDKISKKYGKFIALNSVSLTFENGIYGLLGANGAGKTTLINILIGASNASGGRILLDGKDIRSIGTDYLKLIGFMPQYPKFYPNYRVDEFLEYMCLIKNIDKSHRKSKIDEVIASVNLEEQRKKKIRELSGGMRQRLGIAQALLNDPKILVLDEPTAGLDPGERIRFRNIITEVAKDRMILVATHIVSDVEYIANHIIMLQKGNVACEGTADELREGIMGQVFSITTDDDKSAVIEKNYLVSNMKREGDRVTLRVISDSKPEDSIIVKPQLEEVFLSIFKKESGIYDEDSVL